MASCSVFVSAVYCFLRNAVHYCSRVCITDLSLKFNNMTDIITRSYLHLVDNYPPGLVEVAGTLAAQLLIIIPYGVIYLRPLKSRGDMLKCLPDTVLNTSYVTLVHLLMVWMKAKITSPEKHFLEASLASLPRALPEWKGFLVSFAIGYVIYDFLFWGTHRLLHNKVMYMWFHKKHHGFNAEVPWAAFYVHPVEYTTVNFGLAFVLTALMRAHVASLWFTTSYFMFVAQTIHCPKPWSKVPFLMNHEGHHSHRDINYGAVGIADSLFGTFTRRKGRYYVVSY